MRNTLLTLMMTAAGLMAATDGVSMTAKVPFAFEAQGLKMEAGRYEVTHLANKGLIRLRKVVGGGEWYFRATPGTDNRNGVNGIVFNRYGARYFLNGMSLDTSIAVFELPKQKAEKELAKGYTPETVITTAP